MKKVIFWLISRAAGFSSFMHVDLEFWVLFFSLKCLEKLVCVCVLSCSFKLYLFNLKFWCVCLINVLQFLACEV